MIAFKCVVIKQLLYKNKARQYYEHVLIKWQWCIHNNFTMSMTLPQNLSFWANIRYSVIPLFFKLDAAQLEAVNLPQFLNVPSTVHKILLNLFKVDMSACERVRNKNLRKKKKKRQNHNNNN